MCDELDEATRALLEGLPSRSDYLEIDSGGGVGIEYVNFPGGGLTYPNFSFTHTCRFFSGGDGMADEAGDFEFFCRLLSG